MTSPNAHTSRLLSCSCPVSCDLVAYVPDFFGHPLFSFFPFPFLRGEATSPPRFVLIMSAFLFAVECQWDGVDDVPVWTLLSVEPVSASYNCATEPFYGIKAIGSFVRLDRLQVIVEILQPL